MARTALIVALLALAACGVDGAPEQPEPAVDPRPDGIVVSGELRTGITTEPVSY